MSIVGISGYARAGKDTLAAFFIKRGYEKRSFADGVRAVARRDIQWRMLVDTYGYEEAKDKHPYVRMRLVEIGQSAREVCPDIWIRLAFGDEVPEQFRDVPSYGAIRGPTVFSDVRNVNEAERIRAAGGKVVMITRRDVGPANETEARTIAEIVPDIVIENNGTIEDLWTAAEKI